MHRWLKSFVKQKKLLTSVIRHVAYSQENNGDCLLFGVAPFCFPFYDTHLHAIATCCKAEASLKKKNTQTTYSMPAARLFEWQISKTPKK